MRFCSRDSLHLVGALADDLEDLADHEEELEMTDRGRQLGVADLAAPELGLVEIGLGEVGVAEIGVADVGVFEVDTDRVGEPEIDADHLWPRGL